MTLKKTKRSNEKNEKFDPIILLTKNKTKEIKKNENFNKNQKLVQERLA